MRSVLHGQHITVVSAKGRKSDIALAPLTGIDWIIGLRNVQSAEGSPTVLETVIDGVAQTFSKRPKQFSFPVLKSRFPYSGASGSHEIPDSAAVTVFGELPLETRTWGILSKKKLETSADLLDLNFFQLASELDDLRAAIDIAVTSQSWYRGELQGRPTFRTPQCPASLDESIDLVGVRTLRHCGLDPKSVTYEPRVGVVIADRLGLLRLKPRTLHECAVDLGVTRERVRQIAGKVKWTPSQRRWPQPRALLDMCTRRSINQPSDGLFTASSEVGSDLNSVIGKLTTSDVANILVSLGAQRREIDPIGTRARNVGDLPITRAELQRRAYKFTERLGFITGTELREHFTHEFSDFLKRSTSVRRENSVGEELQIDDALSDLITEVCAPFNLSYGYLYVNGQRGTYFSKWAASLLSCLGPLPFEELYLATQRFCTVQIPRIVFPPRLVIREFLQQNSEFSLDDDEVSLISGEVSKLQGRQKWMYDVISSCAGRVIHRAKLFELARQSGVPFGTVAVYSAYSLYFKPVGNSCVTITGNTPSDAAIVLARDIGAAIAVGTETRRWRVDGTCVIVEISVGTDISHSGVWSPKVNIRNLIAGRKYKVFVDGSQHGHANWSGNLLAGFVTGLQVLGANIGDPVQMSFDTSGEVLELSLLPAE
jgi:hypothetical protein